MAEANRTPSFAAMLAISFRALTSGLKNALSIHRIVLFFVHSRMIRIRFLQCFLLNGLIFLGSLTMVNHLILPAIRYFGDHMELFEGSPVPPNIRSIGESLASALLHLFWLYPIYFMSFILNAVWYQNIAERAFSLQRDRKIAHEAARRLSMKGERAFSAPLASLKPMQQPGALEIIRDEIARLCVMTVLMLQIASLSIIPYVGTPLAFLHSCWLYSYYGIEYRWTQEGWSLAKRLQEFEKHWLFFVGFGLPIAAATFFFSTFVSAGILALGLPMVIVLSVVSDPMRAHTAEASSSWLPERLPIFHLASWIVFSVLKRLSPQPRAS